MRVEREKVTMERERDKETTRQTGKETKKEKIARAASPTPFFSDMKKTKERGQRKGKKKKKKKNRGWGGENSESQTVRLSERLSRSFRFSFFYLFSSSKKREPRRNRSVDGAELNRGGVRTLFSFPSYLVFFFPQLGPEGKRA